MKEKKDFEIGTTLIKGKESVSNFELPSYYVTKLLESLKESDLQKLLRVNQLRDSVREEMSEFTPWLLKQEISDAHIFERSEINLGKRAWFSSRQETLDEAIQICNEAIEDIQTLRNSAFVGGDKSYMDGSFDEAKMILEAIKKLKEE